MVASLGVFGDWQYDLKLLPEFQTVLNSVFLQLALDSTRALPPSGMPADEAVCMLTIHPSWHLLVLCLARAVLPSGPLQSGREGTLTVLTTSLSHISTSHAKPQGPSSMSITETET